MRYLPVIKAYLYIGDIKQSKKYIQIIQTKYNSKFQYKGHCIEFLLLEADLYFIEKKYEKYTAKIKETIQYYDDIEKIELDQLSRLEFLKNIAKYYEWNHSFEKALELSKALYEEILASKNEYIKFQLDQIEHLLDQTEGEEDHLLNYQANGLYYINHQDKNKSKLEKINNYKNESDFLIRTQIINSISKIQLKIPELSASESRVAALLINQLNTKEISSILNVTTKAIEKQRLNLRKKLYLKTNESITTALLKIIED
jgi:DNA-binding CsgD family transcriptional regulator